MAFNFPATPTVGQTYTPAGGPTYAWSGAAWTVVAANVAGGFAQETFTATLGQTSFTVASGYTPGLIDVFQNGVKLVLGVDYTATSGTTVVLSAPAALGDTIQTIAYAAVSGANTYTKAEVDARDAGAFFYVNQLENASLPATTSVVGKPTANEQDPNNWYDPVTGRFTPNIAGLYIVSAVMQVKTVGTARAIVGLRKNGAQFAGSTDIAGGQHWNSIATGMVYLNGTTDYIDHTYYSDSAITLYGYGSNFSGALLRRAA